MNKLPNETELQYLWRVGQAKESGLLSYTWEELTEILNKNLREDPSEYYTSSAYRKKFGYAKTFYDEVFSKQGNDELTRQINELKEERIKIKTEKLETNRWLRADARDQMITEQLVSAINNLTPLQIPDQIELENNKELRSYLLAFGDCHYGIEYKINGLYGDIINEYSPEIFEKRMEVLLARTIQIVENEGIDVLNVWELGDGIQGILRLNSQLMKLRYGIIDSAVRYANYITEWLNKLSFHVRINFQMVVDSNHNQLRICGAPKNAFTEENMSKIMMLIIKERLKNNPNISIDENPTGMNFAVCSGYVILGSHGEYKNLANAVDDLNKAYDVTINYLIGAHIHHSETKEVGKGIEAISIRSICGVDPYGMSLNKTSVPGAKLLCFESGNGITCEYNIKVGD